MLSAPPPPLLLRDALIVTGATAGTHCARADILICREAIRLDRPFLHPLAQNAEISKHVDRAKLAELCDPVNYLGLSGVMVDRVLAPAKVSSGRRARCGDGRPSAGPPYKVARVARPRA